MRDRETYVACFDGGAAIKQGTAGFVVHGLNGNWLVGKALWFGKTWTANNKVGV